MQKYHCNTYMTVIRGLSVGFFDELTLTVAGTVDSDPKSSKSPIPATMNGNILQPIHSKLT